MRVSLAIAFARCFSFRGALARWRPEMTLQVDARFENCDAFALQEFFLEGGVGLANEDLAAFADYAMAGDTLAGRGGGHGSAGAAGSTREAQNFSERPVG